MFPFRCSARYRTPFRRGWLPACRWSRKICGRDRSPERNLPRHLRIHDALTVNEPFPPGASRHFSLLPRQFLVVRIPAENDRYFFDATPGPNIYLKRFSLPPNSPATELSGCLDRYASASVSWGDACPIGFFAGSRLMSRSCLRSFFYQRRAGSTFDPGDSLQPLDRQV